VSDGPTRCLLCQDERVTVQKALSAFIIACSACGARLAYTPHPPDDPSLAGRIELLKEPYQFFCPPPIGDVRYRH